MTTVINDIMNAARGNTKARRSLEKQINAVNKNIATIKRRASALYELPPIVLVQLIPFFGLAVLKSPDYIGQVFRDRESIADFFQTQGATHLAHTARVICTLLDKHKKTYAYRLVKDETSPLGYTVSEFYSLIDTMTLELPPHMDREAFFKTRGMQEGRWLQLKFNDMLNFEGFDDSVKEQIVVSNALNTMFVLMLTEGKQVTTEFTHEMKGQNQLIKLDAPKAESDLYQVNATFNIPKEWEEIFSGDLDLDKVYYRAKKVLAETGKLPTA